MKKSLTCWNVLGWLNIPLFLWVILILITFWIRLYLLIESTILKLHMICTSWLTNQHEWMIKLPLCWMSFLRPIQHFVVRVQFLDIHWVTTILFTPIWNLKIPNHQWLITTLKFRDMKNFDMKSFSSDLISCDILNGSLDDDDDISGERWKLTYTDICDKRAPMKSLRLKERSNPWMTHDIIKIMYERDHVHAKATQSNDSRLWQEYHNLRNKVTCIIKERKNVYFNDIHTLCRNDLKNVVGN